MLQPFSRYLPRDQAGPAYGLYSTRTEERIDLACLWDYNAADLKSPYLRCWYPRVWSVGMVVFTIEILLHLVICLNSFWVNIIRRSYWNGNSYHWNAPQTRSLQIITVTDALYARLTNKPGLPMRTSRCWIWFTINAMLMLSSTAPRSGNTYHWETLAASYIHGQLVSWYHQALLLKQQCLPLRCWGVYRLYRL